MPAIYDQVGSFTDGLAPVKLNGRYFYVDEKGNVALPVVHGVASVFSEGRAVVVADDGKCGYIDTKGTTVVPALYEYAEEFSEGLARVELNGKFGYIDANGTQYWED